MKKLMLLFLSVLLINCSQRLETNQNTTHIPEGFVLVPETEIIGQDVKYALPDTDDSWKGVFIEGRTVNLSSYVIAKYEVTYKLWKEVREWANQNGYVIKNEGVMGGAFVYRENEHSEENGIYLASGYSSLSSPFGLGCTSLLHETRKVSIKLKNKYLNISQK